MAAIRWSHVRGFARTFLLVSLLRWGWVPLALGVAIATLIYAEGFEDGWEGAKRFAKRFPHLATGWRQ